ncbi:ANR family transcriptional regulator [Affinibrenneria salicis]|uniref:ANR family transcriptional regulator n=1 Tax=Affinibrenneria salicis TaxID=2590031 RepID=A0A5J5G0U0_9GAMM|nr:ANR family transcriptional regulator [Affinibrenneria salicis]
MKTKNNENGYQAVAELAYVEECSQNYRQAHELWTKASSPALHEINQVWADARSEHCCMRVVAGSR